MRMTRATPPVSEQVARSILLRDAEPADRTFLLALYASTRSGELAQFGWQPGVVHDFVRAQHDAQRDHYLRHHPDSTCQIIEMKRCPVGRLWLAREHNRLTLLDISVIPGLQRQGIATACLRRELQLADEGGITVELQVLLDSPGRRLFERLGFFPVGDPGLRQAMRRLPANVRLRPRMARPEGDSTN